VGPLADPAVATDPACCPFAGLAAHNAVVTDAILRTPR
jgi:hypothetical protein